MRKLRMELDDLQVESFAAEAEGAAGTVQGNDDEITPLCTVTRQCPDASCHATCDTCVPC
ncbi:MAG: hypothetical protein JO306_10055 [Gemmatimonadetes bacterium]|nr:hypothetical protein [Gemmatimonadota bacterium]